MQVGAESPKRLLPEREKGHGVDRGAGRLCRWERKRRNRLLPEREKGHGVDREAGRLCRWERKRRNRLLPEREKGHGVDYGAGRMTGQVTVKPPSPCARGQFGAHQGLSCARGTRRKTEVDEAEKDGAGKQSGEWGLYFFFRPLWSLQRP